MKLTLETFMIEITTYQSHIGFNILIQAKLGK